MRRSSFFLVTVLCALAFAAAGCGGDDSPEPPEGASAYTGVVESVEADGRVLIQAEGDDCGFVIAETDDTEVLRRDGDSYESASWSDLTEGAEAEVWISGPMANSCPGQASADAVVLG